MSAPSRRLASSQPSSCVSTISLTSGSPSSGTASGLRSPLEVTWTFHHPPIGSADSLSVSAEPMGGWWKVQVTSNGERKPLAVPELGEPLVRLIVDTQLDGWLDASRRDGADMYL